MPKGSLDEPPKTAARRIKASGFKNVPVAGATFQYALSQQFGRSAWV
jgi:hypothetical protein